MELLTQIQVYNEVGATSLSTNEIITKSEAQNIASQKLKRITNDLSNYGDSELIDEFECEDLTRNEYTIQVSYDGQTWGDSTQVLFASSAYSSKVAKRVYIKSLRHVYMISGEKLREEEVGYTIDFSSSKFDRSNNVDGYSFWPKAANVDKQFVIEKFKVVNVEDESKTCTINLIQVRDGLELVYGDVVDFTYSWNAGRDLDQATTVECFISGLQGKYVGYGTNSRVSLPNGTNILGFAGDNTGTGQEHALVDFDSLASYIDMYGDNNSTVSGKTIKESLTDENGLVTCKVYLYTVWFAESGHDINMSYTAYKKNGEAFGWSNAGDYTFNINGVTLSGERTLPAYCSQYGKSNYNNPPSDMTLSATFTYYFNSGMFSIETNKS